MFQTSFGKLLGCSILALGLVFAYVNGDNTMQKKLQSTDTTKGTTATVTTIKQDTYGTYADEQLNKKIRDRNIRGNFWDKYTEVFLVTFNGNVKVEGVVPSLEDQTVIIKEIQKVPGVKSVTSNLRIDKTK